ncbi:MAG: serine/threonine protein kinase [Myxococcaceae bacterium]|nr:serine/threonine protein kinase [Myxococcaceae bacterium]
MNLPRSFGAYTLLRRLAVGGMAEIYVARTIGLGGFEKLAALKLVHPHLSADPQFVRMLIDEAKIVVLLTHANIAQVFDLGCIDGTYFIAMEYVDGVDVQGLSRAAERLGRSLDVPVCCFVVAELLNGLDYAHRKRDPNGRPLGIVHRDISPQNVVVSRGGEVKLVDFGIAKTNLRAERTEVGVIKGKYGYMSPEQAWADPTDRRSDVFSAGVMLYELLTGSVLYTAKSVAELIAKVRRAEIPSPSSVRPDIPEELSSIVMRALALEPSDRYQTALEMGDALREYLYQQGDSLSGARLGRYVAELLEADARLADENARRVSETGGLRALRREEFMLNDNSVIFSLPELSAATRSQGGVTARPRARDGRDGASNAVASRSLSSDVDTVPPRMPVSFSSAAEVASARAQAHASDRVDRRVEDASPAEPNTEDLTELWTARWFAQRGHAFDFVTEIRQGDSDNDTTKQTPASGPRADAQLIPATALLPEQTNSMAPPTLSWPPRDPSFRPLVRGKSPAPPALMPPRGEDPSLAPLPRLGDVPNFRRASGKPGLLRRHLLLLLAFALIGALGAWLAWDSVPLCTLELLSLPAGATVRINGALQRDKTPLRVSGLRRSAVYRLRLELANHKPVEVLFEAKLGTARRTIALPPN